MYALLLAGLGGRLFDGMSSSPVINCYSAGPYLRVDPAQHHSVQF
jgi:hypothetical protein